MKKITGKSLYLGSRYKWYDVNGNTVPDPYFPKTEITKEDVKITCTEWHMIMKVYFEELVNELLKGKVVYMGRNGELVLLRGKGSKKNLNKFYNDKKNNPNAEMQYHSNLHTNGYYPIYKWLRNASSGCVLRNRKYFKFNLSRTLWKIISDKLFTHPHLINNFKDVDVFLASYKKVSKQRSTEHS